MKRSRTSVLLLAVALLVLALLIYPSVDFSAAHDPLRAAWDRALVRRGDTGTLARCSYLIQPQTQVGRRCGWT
jgi:hypothetical protein